MAKASGGTRSNSNSAGNNTIPANVATYINTYNSGAGRRTDLLDGIDRNAEKSRYDSIKEGHDPHYTLDQQRGIKAYARNSGALSYGLENDTLTPWQERQIKRLDSAFVPLKESLVVYKGWGGGELRVTKGYNSVSTSMLGADPFGHSDGGYGVFRIPKGTPVIFGDRGEFELILPRGFDLRKHRIL